MAEMPKEETGGGEAAMKDQLEKMQQQIADAVKRAEEAERKFEMTKQERSEEREKRQKEAEKNQQYEEAKRLQDERLAEMQAEAEKLKLSLSELDAAKSKAAQWDAYNEKRRSELIALIPEADREVYKDAPLALLEKTVELLGADRGGAHRGAPHKPSSTGSGKWSEMSDEERANKAAQLSVDELTKLIAAG
jgi:DNA repair exonuclease SbcCD ATPase subunit